MIQNGRIVGLNGKPILFSTDKPLILQHYLVRQWSNPNKWSTDRVLKIKEMSQKADRLNNRRVLILDKSYTNHDKSRVADFLSLLVGAGYLSENDKFGNNNIDGNWGNNTEAAWEKALADGYANLGGNLEKSAVINTVTPRLPEYTPKNSIKKEPEYNLAYRLLQKMFPKEYPDYLINLDFTDCGNNEELFKAIAALRDDSDYMQWFVCDSSYIVNNDDYPIYINESHIKGEWFLCKNDNFGGDYSENWHKASVKELIEHFK